MILPILSTGALEDQVVNLFSHRVSNSYADDSCDQYEDDVADALDKVHSATPSRAGAH
jgi:hypothetical protein